MLTGFDWLRRDCSASRRQLTASTAAFDRSKPSSRCKPRYRASQTNMAFETTSVESSIGVDPTMLAPGAGPGNTPAKRLRRVKGEG